jgi:hypothetical protein
MTVTALIKATDAWELAAELRTRVALDLAWEPASKLLEEIHDGDPLVRRD